MSRYIQQLPPEVLEIIFSLFVHSAAHINQDHMYLGQLPPLLLTQVDSAWRRLICATPHLWSRLNLTSANCGRGGSSSIRRGRVSFSEASLLNILNLYLTSSRTHPLYIKLSGFQSDTLAPLCVHSNRWKELMIFATGPPCLSGFTSIRGRLKMLEKLTLLGSPSTERPILPFDHTPCLTTVSLSGNPSTVFSFPQKTVRSLTVESIGSTGVIDLSTIYPNLIHLAFCKRPPQPNDEEDLVPGSIHLPHLKTLKFLGKPIYFPPRISRTGIRILAALSVPEIKKLSIEDLAFPIHVMTPDDVIDLNPDILADINAVSDYPLRHVDLTSLTLHQVCITQEQVFATLSQLPHLLDLTLAKLTIERRIDHPVLPVPCSSSFCFQSWTPSSSSPTSSPSNTQILPHTLKSLRIESSDSAVEECVIQDFISHHISTSTSSSVVWLELVFSRKTFSREMTEWLQSYPLAQRGHFDEGGAIRSHSTHGIFLSDKERCLLGNVGLRVTHEVELGSKQYMVVVSK